MHPELLLMVIREDHERLGRDAARARLAASLDRPGGRRLPRRIVGRLLVRAGLWLPASLPATSELARGPNLDSRPPGSGHGRAVMAP